MVDSTPKTISYPAGERYGHYENCTWNLIAPASHVVRALFITFDLEAGHNRCPYDRLTVYDSNGQRKGR